MNASGCPMPSHPTRRVRRLTLSAALAALPFSSHAQSATSIRDLDVYIQTIMKEWGAPGLAIAVVKDDSVIFAKGYGVREVGKPAPVTVNSLFAIGSNSKLFTAVAAGMAVDEGKLKWAAPVTTYLPWFQLYDPFASREITVRDMLSHNSGLGRRGDPLWYGTVYTRHEVLRRVRYLKPIASFRTEYGYQNIMVMGAGEATAAAMGMSWDDIIRTRIFAPLGMTASNTSVRDFKPGQDVAMPHSWRDGHAVQVPYRNIDNIAPAGSINSNVLEMARWLRMLLAGGKFNGKQLVSAASLREIESPHTYTGGASDSLTHFSAYGLGVGMRDYRGVKLLSHNGGIDGMLSAYTFIPEKGVAVVVLTNLDGRAGLDAAVANRALDTFMGWPLRDGRAALAQAQRADAAQSAQLEALESARVQGTSPLALDRYAGTYTDDMYGDVTIALENEALAIRSSWDPNLAGKLTHWHYNVFRIDPRPDSRQSAGNFVRFDADERARVSSLTLQLGEPVSFRKVVSSERGGPGGPP
jgi:CubicO group peptidase (beta-lactamase class C family)